MNHIPDHSKSRKLSSTKEAWDRETLLLSRSESTSAGLKASLIGSSSLQIVSLVWQWSKELLPFCIVQLLTMRIPIPKYPPLMGQATNPEAVSTPLAVAEGDSTTETLRACPSCLLLRWRHKEGLAYNCREVPSVNHTSGECFNKVADGSCGDFQDAWRPSVLSDGIGFGCSLKA